LQIVQDKLILFNNEDKPFKCSVRIKKCVGLPSVIDKGGYIVQPVAAPCGDKFPAANCKTKNEQGNSQKPQLFKRGNAISEVSSCKGIT
jgi:hypothetical protein